MRAGSKCRLRASFRRRLLPAFASGSRRERPRRLRIAAGIGRFGRRATTGLRPFRFAASSPTRTRISGHSNLSRIPFRPRSSARTGLRIRSTDSFWPISKRMAWSPRRRRQKHAAAPRDLRSDRPSAHRKRDQRFSCGPIAECFRESGGSSARLAALWRTLGPALAGRDALCRFHRQRRRSPLSARLALSRLRDRRPSTTTCRTTSSCASNWRAIFSRPTRNPA